MSEAYWTYQIVKYKDKSGFGLHEVFYNDDDEPWSMTSDPEVLDHLGSDIDDDPVTAEGLKQSMAVMLADAIRHDVLEEPEEWAEPSFQTDLDQMKKEMGGLPDEVEGYTLHDELATGKALLDGPETDDLEHDARREEEPEQDAL